MKWVIQQFRKPAPGHGGTGRPLVSVAAKVMVLLLATAAHAQNSQFFFDDAGNFTVQTAVSTGTPQILGQPQMQVVIPGELASFSVVVANTSGVSYQWFFGSSAISGATSDSLLITNVSTSNQGFYWVSVSNSSGSTASTLANLYIDSRGCGMPDSWQLQYFGNLTQNALGDYDGDGVNNLQEFLDGTNPTNAASTLYQIYLQNDGGTVVFSPNQTVYTNGQVVTLTAIGSNTAPFYAWTGDVTTRSNAISVVMTTNKYLYAHFTPMTFQWTNNNASGDWFTVANWTPNLAPGSNDSIILVAGGTITMNSNVDLTDITFGLAVNDVPLGSDEGNAPTLTGAGAITVHGTLDWDSGSIAGSLQITIAPGAMLDFDSPSGVLFSGRTLENQGTVYWSGLGNISLNGVITNDVGALFEMQNPVTMQWGGGPAARFDNAGTLITSTNAGTTSFEDVEFDNYGTVNIQSGTLTLYGGGTNAGTISVPAGATLNLAEGVFVASGSSSITGAGNLTVSGAQATLAGTVDVTGPELFSNGSVDFTDNYICTNTIVISGCQASFDGTGTVAPPILTLSGGGALGGSNVVTIGSVMNWTGGSLTGTGRTVILPGATLNIASAGALSITSYTLDNAGTALWSGGTIDMIGGVMTNEAGAFFQIQSPASISVAGGSPRFDNAGTVRFTGSGTTSLSFVPFNNYNDTQIQGGTLQMNGLNNGTMEVSAGTTLSLGYGAFNASAVSSITGTGNFTVTADASATLSGLLNVSGTHTFSSGFAELNGNYICTNNTMIISGGTASFDGTGIVAPSTLTLSSGAFGGSNVVTVGSMMNWTGGSMSGTGRTVIPPAATLNIASASPLFITSSTLDNGGTALWSGGTIGMIGGVITNEAGALFQIQNPASIFYDGGSPRFDNAGTVRITGSGTTLFANGNFNNYHDTQIQGGTLQIDGGLNNGTMEVLAGTTLSVGSGTFNASPASSITGAGNFTVAAGSATLSGLLNVTGTHTFSGGFAELNGNYICTSNTMILSDGTASFDGTGTVAPSTLTLTGGSLGGSNVVTVGSTMTWTGGSMSGSGRTVISPGATLTIANPSFLTITTRTLDNGGTTVWTGAGSIVLNAAVITNRVGALFNAQNSSPIFFGGGAPRFDNAGTFRKSVNIGTTTIGGSVNFNNFGTVDIQSGFLGANGGYDSSSNAVLNCALAGTSPGTNYGQLLVSGPVTLSGTLSVNLTNNFVPTTNDSFTVLTAGTCSGTFANFIYPSNEVSMILSNTATSVIVRAMNILALPQGLLWQPQFSGGNFSFSFQTTSNQSYTIQENTNSSTTNWFLVTNITGDGSLFEFVLPITTSNPQDFFRVRQP
jgi:Divergent InlB B-repeat domain